MGIKIDAELKVNGSSESLLCCDCPDQQCYDDCCEQCEGVLSDVRKAGSAAYYGTPPTQGAKPHGAILTFKATCGKTGTTLTDVVAKFPVVDDATLKAVRDAFDDCRNHPAVKKVTVKKP